MSALGARRTPGREPPTSASAPNTTFRIFHTNLRNSKATATSLRVVETMHARKALMAELADAFLALPGGFGTAEEFFEVLTWAQLGLHTKPCGLLNVKGYFDYLIRSVDHAVQEESIDSTNRALLLVDDASEALLAKLEAWKPAAVDRAAWATGLMIDDR